MRNAEPDLLRVVCGCCAEVLGLADLNGETNFFEAGGRSLDAARLARDLRQRLGHEVALSTVLRHPRLSDLAKAIQDSRPKQVVRVAAARSDRLPVTAAQERLLLRDARHRRLGRPPYVRTVSWCRRIAAAIDSRTLADALQALVRRHDGLHTTYRLVDGHGYATVHRECGARLAIVDLRDSPVDQRLSRAIEAAAADVDTPFDRVRLPRLRATLYRLGTADVIVHLVADHMVGDARTVEVLGRDLAELYDATRKGREPALPVLPLRYVDWVLRERRPERLPRRERLLDYWREEVVANRFFPYADLPFTRAEPRSTTYLGAQHRLGFDSQARNAMVSFARSNRTTMFVAYLATFVAMLYGVTGERDLTVVVPDDNREDPDLEHVVGWFATSMALRFRLTPRPTFADVATVAHESILTALEHRGISFGEALDSVSGQRQSAPVAVIRFEYNDAGVEQVRFDGVPANPIELPFRSAGLGLAVWSRGIPDQRQEPALEAALIHGLEHYDPRNIAHVLDTWHALTSHLLARPDRPIADLMSAVATPPRASRLVSPMEPT